MRKILLVALLVFAVAIGSGYYYFSGKNYVLRFTESQLQEKLNAAMQKLSEAHRLVVTLHDVQGLSHDEISKIMDCNTGTVRSRLFYARQQLQGHLSEYLT